jgi:ribosomal protein S12 methylthiotransferase
VPGVAIRTTCIVGFPGETESDFAELMEFLEEMRFERVGAFTYSPQEGTRAADMTDDVPDAIKRERLERLTELQRAITADLYESRIGSVARMIVDRTDQEGRAAGRLPWQADDIDGVTSIDGTAAPGEFLDVAIEQVVDDYDFVASIVRRVGATPPVERPRSRMLPVAATMGSYGR